MKLPVLDGSDLGLDPASADLQCDDVLCWHSVLVLDDSMCDLEIASAALRPGDFPVLAQCQS